MACHCWGRPCLCGQAEIRTRKGGLAMPTEISRDRVQQLVAEGAHLFDVRPEREFMDEHIVGAHHLWLKTLDATTTAGLDKALATVVY